MLSAIDGRLMRVRQDVAEEVVTIAISNKLGKACSQSQISPILGPPLMFIFVCLTNILLITSLISLLSNSLTKVCLALVQPLARPSCG